ncbi:non-hydrolyzing UDP-N-acetylglucosamine 2-epimerase [Saccharicrinis sp. FJH62]|uniref:non-hydrolyzing UDP-N-acetylglucosamine 2-epimerase n=1 Tax=Saccharicrinis sp. FJH62 TaxID=3344657 RepID=UPI0035D404FD
MKIISVVGARPNFMKIAPFIKAIDAYNNENDVKVEHILVHTGQHYDDRMSRSFFEALDIPDADINLGIGSGTHAEQVGNTMIAFEKVLLTEKPDWVVVVGDVNATLACSVTAKKEHVKVCHIEAGLRSGDMQMPEEINRLVTDRLSDLLLTPDKLSIENLKAEGVEDKKIEFVGNIMIDTLEAQREKAQKLEIRNILKENLLDENELPDHDFSKFGIVTLHRPSNVDDKTVIGAIVNFFMNEVVSDLPLIWPIHPRTQKQLKTFGLWDAVCEAPNLVLLHPLGYHDLLRLNMDAEIMLTDSGGLQEECTILGTPCLTLRWNTERPITLREYGGASVLVGNNIERIRSEYFETIAKDRKPQRPELWDGKTAERCLRAILEYK